MLVIATVGLKPYATTRESNETDDDCAFFPAPVDSLDTERSVDVCYSCAEVNV
jgi:hypothetical protein